MASNRHDSNERRLRRRILLIGLIVIAALVLIFFGLRQLEIRSEKPQERGDAELRHTYDSTYSIEYNGETYHARKGLTTILLMGIDQFSTEPDKNSYRNGGQADFLRLLVVDSAQQTIHQIAIDRDTMTPITILGVLGNRTGTRTERISLSHGFGKGGDDSCHLTVEAASNLLYSIPIDFYVTLSMDGISELNDLLGGVEVTLKDDFSQIDPAMTAGKTMRLTGDQAEIFVRARMSMNVGTNEARMVRQQEYLQSAQNLLRKKISEGTEALEALYDGIAPYLTTNFSRGRMINEAYAAKDYKLAELLTPDGKHSVDDRGFTQFEVNEEDLLRIVISVFYEKANKEN